MNCKFNLLTVAFTRTRQSIYIIYNVKNKFIIQIHYMLFFYKQSFNRNRAVFQCYPNYSPEIIHSSNLPNTLKTWSVIHICHQIPIWNLVPITPCLSICLSMSVPIFCRVCMFHLERHGLNVVKGENITKGVTSIEELPLNMI